MTFNEAKEKAKEYAGITSDATEIVFKCGGLIVLMKLLYKQKIKPITALMLLGAYRVNDKDVIESVYSDAYEAYLKRKKYTDVPEKEDEKTIGFKY